MNNPIFLPTPLIFSLSFWSHKTYSTINTTPPLIFSHFPRSIHSYSITPFPNVLSKFLPFHTKIIILCTKTPIPLGISTAHPRKGVIIKSPKHLHTLYIYHLSTSLMSIFISSPSEKKILRILDKLWTTFFFLSFFFSSYCFFSFLTPT